MCAAQRPLATLTSSRTTRRCGRVCASDCCRQVLRVDSALCLAACNNVRKTNAHTASLVRGVPVACISIFCAGVNAG
ncbi:hypothetical protein EON66_12395 [archaeon]|nr:MAG: hypothetical protein EON66_12395 [archaeon]